MPKIRSQLGGSSKEEHIWENEQPRLKNRRISWNNWTSSLTKCVLDLTSRMSYNFRKGSSDCSRNLSLRKIRERASRRRMTSYEPKQSEWTTKTTSCETKSVKREEVERARNEVSQLREELAELRVDFERMSSENAARTQQATQMRPDLDAPVHT